MLGPALASWIGRRFPTFGALIVVIVGPIVLVVAVIELKDEAIVPTIFGGLCIIAAIQKLRKTAKQIAKID